MYKPRAGHEPVIHLVPLHAGQQAIYDELGYRNLLRCGRRFGKTTLLETAFGFRATQGRKIGWFAPDYKLLRPTFARLRRALAEVTTHVSSTTGTIELVGGGMMEMWSMENNPDAGRSRDYDDVVIDEASLKKKGLEDVIDQAIRPTLLDRDGTLTIAGTPKGMDPESFFYIAATKKELGYKEFHAPSWNNPTLSQDAIARLKTDYPPLVFSQEFEADWVDWSGQAYFSVESLTVDGQPVDNPSVCDAIVAYIDTATKTGKEHDGTGLLICAYFRWPTRRLVLLDWDLIQMEGALLELWLPGVIGRCQGWAQSCHARAGFKGVFIEDKNSGSVLIQQAQRRKMPVFAIDSKITSWGKEERAFNASGYVFRGQIKFARHAFEKTMNFKGDTANHLRRQVLGYRVGNMEQTQDDLLDCFCYAVATSVGDSYGF